MDKTSTQKSTAKNHDKDLLHSYDEAGQTEEFPFEPRQHVINNILSYSKALNVQRSASVEYVETVLN